MATPAVSGALALVQEYVNDREKWHHLPDAPTATNVLLRAFAIQAGGASRPTPWGGFGVPGLERVLVFEEAFAERGLRFLTGSLSSEEELVLTVNLSRASATPLVVTLAWNDSPVPLSANDVLFPVMLDLDLLVIGPSGDVTYGNMGAEEDSLATVEKDAVANPVAGTYAIHVRANPFLAPDSAEFAIVVNGPFAHDDFAANPPALARTTARAPPANCDALHTGRFCGVPVVALSRGTAYRTTIGPREYRYFRIVGPAAGGRVLSIASRPTAGKVGVVRLIVNLDNKARLSLPRFVAGMHEGPADIDLDLEDYEAENAEALYVAVFADFREQIDYEILWKGDPDAAGAGLQPWVVPVIVSVVLVVAVAIGVVVFKMCARSGRTGMEMTPTSALLDDVYQPENPSKRPR
jgi:hypothetical protein